jgi:hypothetical protein
MALIAAVTIPIAYGVVLNWGIFAADDWDRSSLTKIALCVVVAAAGLALPRGSDAGDSPGALGLFVGAAVAAAVALTAIAVTPRCLPLRFATACLRIRSMPSGVANTFPIRSRGRWRSSDLQ